eukprot:g4447.t1
MDEVLAYYRKYGAWDVAAEQESYFDFIAQNRTTREPVGPGGVRPGPGLRGLPPRADDSEGPRLAVRSARPPPFVVTDMEGRIWISGFTHEDGEFLPRRQLKLTIPIMDAGTQIGYALPAQVAIIAETSEEIGIGLQDSWLYSILIAVGLMIPVGVFMGNRLGTPIKRLHGAVVAMQPGAIHQEVPVTSSDELGELTKSFNIMSSEMASFVQIIEEQKAKIVETEALRKEGMASISHELRTPLSNCVAQANAMLDGVRPMDSEQMGLLSGALDHLTKLVDDLFQLALADVNALDCSEEVVDLANLADETVQARSAEAATQHIQIIRTIPEQLEVVGDAKRLRQIIDNVLENAFRYAGQGAEIKVGLKREAEFGELTVSDNGPGVPLEMLDTIFDRFQRGEVSRDRATGGTGLGLSLVKAWAEAQGGSGGGTPDPEDPAVAVSGGGVKGPLVNALVSLYELDLTADDLKGSLVSNGSTDTSAAIQDLEIPADSTGYFLIEFVADGGTVDLANGLNPVLDILVSVVSAEDLLASNSVYATPLSTMVVALAYANADEPSPYSGNQDLTISLDEFLAALDLAQEEVKATLGFGLGAEVDILSTPPLITDQTTTTDEQEEVAAYRLAIEALAAVMVQLAEDNPEIDSPQAAFEAITEDLEDGEIDGMNGEQDVEALADLAEAIEEQIDAIDVANLVIPDTDTPVADIEEVLADETDLTGVDTNVEALENGDISVEPEAVYSSSDADEDGVPNNQDAFPEDSEEWVDTDGDGIGNNADEDDDNDGIADAQDEQPEVPDPDAPLIATLTVNVEGDGYVYDNTEADIEASQKTKNDKATPVESSVVESSVKTGGKTEMSGESRAQPSIELMNIDRFSERSGTGVVVFNDRMWVIAGEENLEWKNDVWSSVDGKNWTLETENAGFCGRYNHKVFVFKNKLWLLGGSDDNFNQLKDIWSSADGVTWKHEVIPERDRVSAVSLSYVFNEKLWLAFGAGADLWATKDGSAWQMESSKYLYPEGAKDIVECGGKLWLFSTSASSGVNRVWSSEDGIQWNLMELNTAEFAKQTELNVLLHNDEIWLFTYTSIDERAWLWTSKDGQSWTKKSGSIYFGNIDVKDAYLVVFDGQLFVVGGNRQISMDDKENWSSNEGLDWVDQAPEGFYSDAQENLQIEELVVKGKGVTYGNSLVTDAMRNQQSNMTSINALIDNLPGVTVNEGDTYGFDDWSTAITIRGFSTNLNEQQVGTTIDGLPNGGSNYGGGSKANRFIDPANMGGIEVTQGTADIASRSHEALGGTINYLSDDPTEETGFLGEVSTGEFDAKRYSLRFDTGAFAPGTQAWVSYSYQEATDWITETAENERDHFAAKLVSDQGLARISAYLSYDDTHEDNYQRVYSAAQFESNSESDGLSGEWTGVPVDDQNFRQAWSTLRENTFAYVKADFDFSEAFVLNTALYYHQNEGRGDWVPPYLVDVTADTSEVTGGTTVNGNSEITGTVASFTYVDASNNPLVSTVTGCDAYDRDPVCYPADAIPVQSYRHTHYEKDRTGFTVDFSWTTELAGYDNQLRGGLWYEDATRDEIRDWHRLLDARVGPDFDPVPYYVQYSYSFPQETTKLYLEDSLTVAEVTFTLGVKQFMVDIDRDDLFGDSDPIQANSDSDALFSGGLVWQTDVQGLEAFFGYAENFKALSDTLLEDPQIDLTTLEPETSTNMEVGLRYASDRLKASATYYQNDFENRLILVSVSSPAGIDYLGTGEGFYVNTGGIDSSGLELSLDYALTDQLGLYTAFTYNDATYLGTGNTELDELAGINPGFDVLGIPENQFVVSLDWASERLSAGVSAKYTGDRYANTTNTWGVDAYTVTDAYIGTTIQGIGEGVHLNLVANNLLDEDYLGTIVNNGAWIGAPRTLSLSAVFDF